MKNRRERERSNSSLRRLLGLREVERESMDEKEEEAFVFLLFRSVWLLVEDANVNGQEGRCPLLNAEIDSEERHCYCCSRR